MGPHPFALGLLAGVFHECVVSGGKGADREKDLTGALGEEIQVAG